MSPTAHQLPRLHLQQHILQEAPHLARVLHANGAAQTSKAGTLETPRLFDALLNEDELRTELEEVKADRAALLRQLAAVHATPVDDWQQRDILTLRTELAARKSKYNQLIAECERLRHANQRAQLQLRDCMLLMPSDDPVIVQCITSLQQKCKVLEEDAGHAAVRNQLYLLLLERTRREHHAIDQRVRATTRLRDLAHADVAAMHKAVTDARRRREGVELQMRDADLVFQEVVRDWRLKLRDRHAETREVQRRQEAVVQRDTENRNKREQTAARRADRARQAAEEAVEGAVHDAQLLPQLEALERGWTLIKSTAGVGDVEGVLAHWHGLQHKEGDLQELLRIAEARQAEARACLARLLESRGSVQAADEDTSSSVDDAAALERRLEAAQRVTLEACTHTAAQQAAMSAAQQGLHFLVDRLRLALSVRPQQLPGNLRSVSEGFTPKASPKGGPGRSTGGGYTSRGPSATGGPPHTARRGGLARQLSADAVSPAHQASNPPSARETPRAVDQQQHPEQPQQQIGQLVKARTASALELVKQLSNITSEAVAREEARPGATSAAKLARMGSGISIPSTLRHASSNTSTLLQRTTNTNTASTTTTQHHPHAAATEVESGAQVGRLLQEVGGGLMRLGAVRERLLAVTAAAQGASGTTTPEPGTSSGRGSAATIRSNSSRAVLRPNTSQKIAPRRQLSSRHRTASLLRRGLGAPPRPAEGGRHAALSRLVGYTPSEDGSGGGMGGSTNGPLSGGGPLVGGHGMMSHVTSSVPRETGAEGANVNGSEVAEEALHQLNRAAIKRRAAAAAAVAAEVKV